VLAKVAFSSKRAAFFQNLGSFLMIGKLADSAFQTWQ
jgi:hypothetical protein